MSRSDVFDLMRREDIVFVDFKFVDIVGQLQHFTMPADQIEEDVFDTGIAFDGSSILGYRGIEQSDMVLIPDPETAFVEPFTQRPTLSLLADIYLPDLTPYERDPRGVAKRAEAFLKSTGIADEAFFGPEPEFFIFDEVRYQVLPHETFFSIASEEANWTPSDMGANLGYHIRTKQGYAPTPPSDTLGDLRGEIVLNMAKIGFVVERHHHEVATAGQSEINFVRGTLTDTADKTLLYKYVVRNTSKQHGKTATFMPKPIYGDNGSGMHVHQSLWKAGTPLFYSEHGYAHLSDLAHYYIGGILHHAPALVALTNATANSYRRLVPGYEAPVDLVFSQGNRSAAVRVPTSSSSPKAARIEFRTPDASGNPYLSFAAMLMAGLDGIKRRIDPTKAGFGPVDKNIYALTPEERKEIHTVPSSLDQALTNLERDHEFLLEGGVFTEELVQTWINYKRDAELEPLRLRTSPYEYFLYFDI